MDLVAACRAFVHVSERGSFTLGAAAAQMSQSVASRRVAALEEHLGTRLLERSQRRTVLTAAGRELLPGARRLVRAAEVLEHEARAVAGRPLRLAVPVGCGAAALAGLVADARTRGVPLRLLVAPPPERAESLHTREARVALLAAPAEDAQWQVELGLAGVADPGVRKLYVETLRPRRRDTGPARRIWLQPEDDVPHVRDRLGRLCDALGLRPAQYATAEDLPAAAAEVYGTRDLLLCSWLEAEELGLHWRPLGELPLARGYVLGGGEQADVDRVHDRLGPVLARRLGADTPAPADIPAPADTPAPADSAAPTADAPDADAAVTAPADAPVPAATEETPR
ncbi:LysR family transcriptional regulator [Streptomyces sp. P38-E01]|uniref:LysR family transcriptional regulator n=1 Tax=Streptomyces tardus TaxID=2780544 RepID=A0A949N5T5_9ACTN|nr:LysR family transcriptional regulator [Streptomyces tardus]MBU7598342.1 LysR family transcriptional regulator [Streptomyces tardus]